jgi:hypothetical protein
MWKKIINISMRQSFVLKFLRKYNWIVHIEYARPHTEWVHTGRFTYPVEYSSQTLEYKFVEKKSAKDFVTRLYTNFNCTRCGTNTHNCKYHKL